MATLGKKWNDYRTLEIANICKGQKENTEVVCAFEQAESMQYEYQ
jgi:hypothetical protein